MKESISRHCCYWDIQGQGTTVYKRLGEKKKKKGQGSFNRRSRHRCTILQDCLHLPSSIASALSGLTSSQMALIHSSVSARPGKRREMAQSDRGKWGTELGAASGRVCGPESFSAPFQGIHMSSEEYKLKEQA